MQHFARLGKTVVEEFRQPHRVPDFWFGIEFNMNNRGVHLRLGREGSRLNDLDNSRFAKIRDKVGEISGIGCFGGDLFGYLFLNYKGNRFRPVGRVQNLVD